VPTAPSNAAFDAHLRSLDPAMGLRDAMEVSEQGLRLGLEALADEAMPANNRTLVFRKRGIPIRHPLTAPLAWGLRQRRTNAPDQKQA
jgi:hypothetical protein